MPLLSRPHIRSSQSSVAAIGPPEPPPTTQWAAKQAKSAVVVCGRLMDHPEVFRAHQTSATLPIIPGRPDGPHGGRKPEPLHIGVAHTRREAVNRLEDALELMQFEWMKNG